MQPTLDTNGPPAATSAPSNEPPLLYRIEAAAELLSIGRSKLYELIAAGEVRTVKIGRATRVPLDSIEAYVDRLRTAANRTPEGHRAAS